MVSYTLRQLTYFVAAADGGSVAEAARGLNVSQPSVSSAITKLEALFGVQLLLRHPAQGVSLTSAGQRLLAEARGLLSYAEELGERAQGLGQAIRGRLDIGCFLTMTPLHLPYLVTSFTKAFPEAALQLHEGHQDILLDGLESGRFDLALLFDVGLGDDFRLEPLAAFQPYAVLPEGHPLAKQPKVRLRQLAPEPMVLLDVAPSREYFTSLFHRAGLEPTIRFHSPSFETVRSMVGNGAGYSILVTRAASDLTYDGRRVVALPIADKVEPGRIVLAHARQARLTRLAETFGNHCKDYFARQGKARRAS